MSSYLPQIPWSLFTVSTWIECALSQKRLDPDGHKINFVCLYRKEAIIDIPYLFPADGYASSVWCAREGNAPLYLSDSGEESETGKWHLEGDCIVIHAWHERKRILRIKVHLCLEDAQYELYVPMYYEVKPALVSAALHHIHRLRRGRNAIGIDLIGGDQ